MSVDPQLLTGLGAVAAVFFSAFGSAIASAHGGLFAIRGKGPLAFVPIIQAGVLSIYGLIVAVLLVGRINGVNSDPSASPFSEADGYRYLAAGLATGLTCLASGWGMAKLIQMLNEGGHHGNTVPSSGSNTVRTPSSGTEPTDGLLSTSVPLTDKQEDKSFFKKLILSMIFVEAIGLYGLIVGLILVGHK